MLFLLHFSLYTIQGLKLQSSPSLKSPKPTTSCALNRLLSSISIVNLAPTQLSSFKHACSMLSIVACMTCIERISTSSEEGHKPGWCSKKHSALDTVVWTLAMVVVEAAVVQDLGTVVWTGGVVVVVVSGTVVV